MIYTKEQARELLLQEYPHLKKQHFKIVKQFVSVNGRTYNAFLIKLDKGMIVAKAIAFPKYSLENEWKILRRLNHLNFPAPRLVMPDHTPQNFLLTVYVEGTPAIDLPDDKELRSKMFYQIGLTTGLLHSIPVDNFGDLLHPENIDWIEYLREVIDRKLEGCKGIISEELHEKSVKYLKKLQPAFKKESGGSPVLIHRDIYLDNFIMTENFEKAILIDYIMAIGGRPLNDLAKFYILVLYHNPEYRDIFLDGYLKHIDLQGDLSDRLNLYIYKELLGMIYFFTQTNDIDARDHAVTVLEELISGKGKMSKLINE